MSKKRKYAALLIVTFLFASATFSGAEESPESRFVMVLSGGDMTMDPLHSYRTTELQIATGIYEGLVTYHPETLRPIPGVAYRWEVSEDRKTYTFHLRRRARFSNGDPVTAEDFRESWLRIINPDDEGEYSFFFDIVEGAAEYRAGVIVDSHDVGFRVVDRHTLVVELSQPASHFLAMLCHMTFAPIHEKYRDTTGWETSAPLITNGPYSLARWDRQELVLEKNEYYWDTWNVEIESIEIHRGLATQASTDGLNDGTIQWSVDANANELSDRDAVQVAPLFATSYLYFRANEEPWSDFRVRKGLARIVPWDSIRRTTTPFATDTLVPALGFYPEVEGLNEQDVAAGLELLKAAGFPEGRGLPKLKILVVPGSIAAGAAREISAALKRHLTMEVEIENVSFGNYQERVREGNFAIGSSTWIGDYADPLSFLQMWIEGSNLNDAGYSDATYDELITASLGETGEARFETLSKAERRLLTEEVVVLPLSHTLSVNFIDLKTIGGWYANVLDVHPLKYLRYIAPPVPKWYARVDSIPQA